MTCVVENVNYTQIVCETECLTAPSGCPLGGFSPTISVPISGGAVAAECSGAGCRFITSEINTAYITDITPNTQSAGRCNTTFHNGICYKCPI